MLNANTTGTTLVNFHLNSGADQLMNHRRELPHVLEEYVAARQPGDQDLQLPARRQGRLPETGQAAKPDYFV